MPINKKFSTTSKRFYVNGIPRVVKVKPVGQSGGSIVTQVPVPHNTAQPSRSDTSDQDKEKAKKKVFDLMQRI